MEVNPIDVAVLALTLIAIVAYGVWKTRGAQNIEGYLRGDNQTPWWLVGVSIMATQASAITFLSTPGQAYEDGMRFIQFYFGLPVAMVIIAAFVVPLYFRLKVYTAYEYLESRFDLKTRLLTASFFLLQRGLACGITIYAPAIVLSTLLGWDLNLTILIIGVLVIIYTVTGGTKAVAQTQKQQMAVMMGGMILAAVVIISLLPEGVGFGAAVKTAGALGKMNIVDFELEGAFSNRYTFWSGLTGGLFLALSYFGTDQSQVARYLSGKSISEIRLGLLFNGLLKVPMQFIILFVGVLVFVFYLYNQPPLFFNHGQINDLRQSEYKSDLAALEAEHDRVFAEKKQSAVQLAAALETGEEAQVLQYKARVEALQTEEKDLREQTIALIERNDPEAETKDGDYVFLTFVLNNLPVGIVGLLLAVIFSAAMSSTASELNALASTSAIDFYKRVFQPHGSAAHYLNVSKGLTLMWGGLAIFFAMWASLFDNLIELVNILGSLFYGTILGVFVCGFFIRYIRRNAVFAAAVVSELLVMLVYFGPKLFPGVWPEELQIAYLWLNVIGCGFVVAFGMAFQALGGDRRS